MHYRDHIAPVLTVVKNKFFITFIAFVVWMLFFDQYSIVSRVRHSRKIANLEQQEAFYLSEIKRSKRLLQELKGDNENLEKFAREQYLMKKENEDIFVVKEK